MSTDRPKARKPRRRIQTDQKARVPVRRAVSAEVEGQRQQGDPTVCATLEAAWAAADPAGDLGLTHAFHTYPARMHPQIARTLIEEFTETGNVILDPFCGGGTVPLETMVAGRRPIGSDLNPLAIRVAATRTRRRNKEERQAFLGLVEDIAERSTDRVRERVPVLAKIPRSETRWYGPHILKEMAGLLEEIRTTEDKEVRNDLEMIFSSLIVKFSNQESDTAERETTKRLRKGLVTEFFARKASELCEGWEAIESALPERFFPPRLRQSDARKVDRLRPKIS
ncbi:MAG: hypothetical protein KC416_06270, partial [Myxococcales bacterium]|nr:hypothetical protein [Myxococcales bacterium]